MVFFILLGRRGSSAKTTNSNFTSTFFFSGFSCFSFALPFSLAGCAGADADEGEGEGEGADEEDEERDTDREEERLAEDA